MTARASRYSVPVRAFTVLLVLLLVGAGLLYWVGRGVVGLTRSLLGEDKTTITHSVVVERTRAVARLITAETSVRDVVTYEDSRFGSTKRALVVVTGKVQTGIDLAQTPDVEIDHDARVIRLLLPRARVLGVEVTQLNTYDEERGLWNPFRPADRDTIFRLARDQLMQAARELGVTAQAERTAGELLEKLLSTDGYVAEVSFRGVGRRAPVERIEPRRD